MTVGNLKTSLGFRPAWEGWADGVVRGGYTSDLLSDVMARAEEDCVLITCQAHKNTIAVAVLKDLAAVVVVNDRPIPDDMREAARDEGIPLFTASDDQYTASWRLHDLFES